ncbi:MAG: acyl-CoA synthetase [Betaproteobacteria bacterium]|nr:acyl-CoA synthetase [Betaproteobacteria bacterium]
MLTSSIREDYLPPKAFMPRNIRLLPELEYPSRFNLTEMLLDRNIPERADRVAIYHDDERITYRQFQCQVNKFANALRELGVEKGDRVALRSANIPEYLVWNFACWRIGAIPVLLSHLNRASEVAFKINDSEAVAICVHSDSYADVQKVRGECPHLKHVIVYGEPIAGTLNYPDLVRTQSENAASEDMSGEDYARIIYSSGTTGKPKGILTTLEGMLSIGDAVGRPLLNLGPNDVLGGHPFFSFAFGATFLYLPWRFGAAVSIISKFSPERQFELVGEHGITLLMAVPTGFRMMLGVAGAEQRYRLSTLRLCHSAGESLPDTTALEWRERFGQTIIDSMGSSELHYWLSTFEGMPDNKIGSSGFSVPGYENVVVDEQLNPVPAGTPGELLVRGPLGQMYWRRPDAQRKGVCPPDSRFAGWSRPGLYFSQDEDGYFWFKSRLDDMIVTSGYKVPGGEVENALNNHPAVLESAVIGVPDQERGSLIKAFVILKDGISPSPQLAQQLQNFAKQELEPYKYPRLVEFAQAEALPRTVTGKIQRNALRELEMARAGG